MIMIMTNRPFTKSAWIALAGITLLLVLIFVIKEAVGYPGMQGFLLIRFHRKSWSLSTKHIHSSTIAWLYFVLINSFYGGAMTMFFSSPLKLKLNDAIEAINLHPLWRMIIHEGNSLVEVNGRTSNLSSLY